MRCGLFPSFAASRGTPKARCSYRFGDTQVLCTASVEEKVPPHKRGSGEGWVTAEYGMLPRSTHTRSDREAARGKQSGRTQEIQRLIGRSLRAVFDLGALGERTISLDCDVLQADGGTRTAAITGAFVARARRGDLAARRRAASTRSPIRDFVAAVSVGIVAGDAAARPRLRRGRRRCDVDMNVVMTGAGGFVELQGTAEGATFSRVEMDALLALAGKGIDRACRGAARCARDAADASDVRLVLASNNRGKLVELSALFAPLAIELVAPGRARHRRRPTSRTGPSSRTRSPRRATPRGHRAARRSRTTRACASTRSAARPASPRRTSLRSGVASTTARATVASRTPPTTRCSSIACAESPIGARGS